jgi:hypothetical protein
MVVTTGRQAEEGRQSHKLHKKEDAMKLKNLAVVGLVLVGAVGAVISFLVLAAILSCTTDKCEGTFGADVIKGYGIPDGGGSEIRGDGDGNPDTTETCTNSCGNDRIVGQDDEEGDVIWGDDSFGGIPNTGHDYIVAMDGDDVVHGENGNDRIMGGIGEDHLFGGPGNDRMDGGEDDDNAIQGDAGSDIIYGGRGDDTIYGDSDDPDDAFVCAGIRCDDRLYGNEGDDDIYGGAGNDILEGGPGADHLVGGAADGLPETDIYNIRATLDAPAAKSASDTEVIECTVEVGDTGIVVLRGFPRGTPTGGVGSPITIADPNGVSFYHIIPGPGTCIIRRR